MIARHQNIFTLAVFFFLLALCLAEKRHDDSASRVFFKERCEAISHWFDQHRVAPPPERKNTGTDSSNILSTFQPPESKLKSSIQNAVIQLSGWIETRHQHFMNTSSMALLSGGVSQITTALHTHSDYNRLIWRLMRDCIKEKKMLRRNLQSEEHVLQQRGHVWRGYWQELSGFISQQHAKQQMMDDTNQKSSDISTKELRTTTLGTRSIISVDIYRIAELEGLRPEAIPGLALHLLGPVLYAEELIFGVSQYLTPRLKEAVYWQRVRPWVWTPCEKMWSWCEDFLNFEEGWILLSFVCGYSIFWCLSLAQEMHMFRVMAMVWERREEIADAYF